MTKARELRRLTQKELARACGLAQSDLSKIETGKRWPTAPQLVRIARELGIALQWFLTGDNRPGFDFAEVAIELQALGIVDLAIPSVRVPGAFRPPEQIVAWAVRGDLPDPRIVEALPAVFAWNRWSEHLLTGYARADDRRVPSRLAWLADITLTLHRARAFPGGFIDPLPLSRFVARTKPRRRADDLGRPAAADELPPVSRRWNIHYAADLDQFYQRASQLLSLRRGEPLPP